jgi:transposase
MCRKRNQGICLSDTLRLPGEVQAQAVALLPFAQLQVQCVVEALWPDLDLVGETDFQAWKAIEPMVEPPDDIYIPSRVWRCVLEAAGRILRQHADRKRIFELLVPVLTEGEALTDDESLQTIVWRLVEELKEHGTYEKRGYLLNIAEQISRFYVENDRLPTDYFELQPVPVVEVPFLTLAADDGPEKGQVYRLTVEGGEIHLRFKYPRIPEPKGQDDWDWTDEVTISTPNILTKRLTGDGVEQKAPNLRLKTVKSGQQVAVLDFISETPRPPLVPTTSNVLSHDWGVKRLATIVILNRQGNQLTRPFFLNVGGIEGKQARLRAQIDELHAKLDTLDDDDPRRSLLQAEIDRCWRKYRARNQAVAHLASTIIVLLAILYDCDTIAGEWLKTLKVRRKKGGRGKRARYRNWRNSTTVRQAIWSRVEYKAALLGLRTITVPPRGTSHECPRCGKRGITTRSPEHNNSIQWGPWFKCLDPECGYNADRDYIAAVNIALRALEKQTKSAGKDKFGPHTVHRKLSSYIGDSATLPFPSPDKQSVRSQVLTTLGGFSKVVKLRPSYHLLC